MENSETYEDSVMDEADKFQNEGEKFRSSQLQKYGMSGVRIEQAGLRELGDYNLDVDEIEYDNYQAPTTIGEALAAGNSMVPSIKDIDKSEKKDTNRLKSELDDYEGQQTNFQETGGSALRNMQATTTNLQSDLNKVYQQGMTEVYQQRRNAELALDQGNAQAMATRYEANAALWSGLFSAAKTALSYTSFDPSADQKA